MALKLLVASSTPAVYDAATWAEERTLPAATAVGAGTSDSAGLLGIGYASSPSQLFNISDGTPFAVSPSAPLSARDFAFTSDGSKCLFGASSASALYDLTTGASVSGLTSVVTYGAAFDPTDRYVVIGTTAGNKIKVLDTDTLTYSDIPVALADYGKRVRFSPDGTQFAIAHRTGGVSVVDWPSMTYAVQGIAGMSEGNEPAWHPTGSMLAVATEWRVEILETATFSTVGSVTPGGACKCAAFSPDGTMLAVGHLSGNGARVASAGQIVEIASTAPGDYYLTATPEGGGDSVITSTTLSATSSAEPATEIYLPYAGVPVTMSGRVTVSTGGPADEVVIRAWASRKLVARVYPDSNGDWTAQVPPGTYDVSYIKAGCAPVVHGPYEVAA